MIRTITEAEAPGLTIRGDVPDIRAGFTGPVEMLGLHMSRPDLWVLTAYGAGGMANGANPACLRFPVTRPEVQAHLVGWLGRREQPADLYHLLKPAALGGLPDWIRMALIYANVVRVAGGMPAIKPGLAERHPKNSWGAGRWHHPDNPGGWCMNLFDTHDIDAAGVCALGYACYEVTNEGPVIRFEVPNDAP